MPPLHDARHSAAPMSPLPPSRPAPREPRPAHSLSPLSTSTRPPATPPPHDGSRAHSLYSCGSLSYEGVHFSTPVRSRTLSSATPPSHPSPSRLPIGSPARASERRANHRARPSVPTGLGLGDLEKLALAPSPHADASREERAQRRRAVHFNSHAHFSEALRLTLSQHGGTSPKGGDKRGEIEEVPREQPEPDAQHDDDGDFFDDEDFSWEAESPSPGHTSAHRSSSMHELAAAFPSPPKTAPEFPLSLFSLDRDTPPNLPLPPTPPFLKTARSPHIYASTDTTDSRMAMFDPEESMARLEMSMAKLEGFGPAPDAPEPACFFDSEDEDDEVRLDSNPQRNPHRTFPSQVPEDVSPSLAGLDATSPMSDVQSPATDIVDPNSPELDSDVEARLERLLRCLSPSAVERTGFAGSSPPSVASSESVTASSPRTPSASSPLAPPSIELLPEFDFERTRHIRHHNRDHGRGHRRRSSSLSNPVMSGWQSFAKSGMGLDAAAKPRSAAPTDVRASSSTAASSASAYSSAATSATSASGSSPGAGHARTPSAEYRSRGIQTQPPPSARPESPLRKARSTPFISRPVRYYEPAQPILQQKRAVAPPLPPLPALPPLPPVPPVAYLPGSLGLARYATISPSTPREAERTGAGARASAMRVAPHAASPEGHPSWRRVHSPVGTPTTASPASSPPSPRTPPNAAAGAAGGHSSFMHITPEQPQAHSRMSRLWSRARAGLGAGRSPEEAKGGEGGGGGDARKGLKREKSARWRRGSVVQARESLG
ncbi:hypothetical protein DAEQUDRAFT_157116 [Daedalea quercina L-15889]|uniref:Uncharacterized protein n=1 Tax=Daedalea quercina L-15889 TaxID=1314783 RepID=A0A165RQE1_9APHY|nr:hypothetical protein DAEQUDRAFT_157116 [Daedalea quercina L-15889]